MIYVYFIQKRKLKTKKNEKNLIKNKIKQKNKMTNESKCDIVKSVRRARDER